MLLAFNLVNESLKKNKQLLLQLIESKMFVNVIYNVLQIQKFKILEY